MQVHELGIVAMFARDVVREVKLARDRIDENPLTHSFEKVHTAEEYKGGRKAADGDDGQLLRAIPGVPEFREAGARRLLDDLDQADGHAFRQERVAEHELELGDEGAEADVVAGALLAEDDAALLVDLGVEQQQAARVIRQHLQALGEGLGVGVREFQHVLGAVEAGGGVEIGRAHV